MRQAQHPRVALRYACGTFAALTAQSAPSTMRPPRLRCTCSSRRCADSARWSDQRVKASGSADCRWHTIRASATSRRRLKPAGRARRSEFAGSAGSGKPWPGERWLSICGCVCEVHARSRVAFSRSFAQSDVADHLSQSTSCAGGRAQAPVPERVDRIQANARRAPGVVGCRGNRVRKLCSTDHVAWRLGRALSYALNC